jgi:chemotaxis protein MotB
MTDEKKEEKQPIIVVKKKVSHGGHHGGAWKVAYADFVTAMMAFFLVMWLVAQSPKVKEAVGGYFRDPVGFTEKAGKGMLDGGTSPVKSFKFDKAELEKKLQDEKQKLCNMGEKITEAINESADMAKLKEFVEIEMIDEGLRIQLIDASASGDSSIFFDQGSSELKPKTIELLATIAKELGQLPNHVVIEGHTDAKPMNRNNYTNWELSADRANSARRLMESVGLKSEQILEIRGNADTYPRFPSDPDDPRNRRVAIIVLNEAYEDKFKEVELGAEHAEKLE